MRVRQISDSEKLLAFLEKDRLYNAYAIGDLEPGLFAQCSWFGAERSGELRALALHFRGLDPAVLFLTGEGGGIRAVIEGTPCPGRVYLTCRKEHLALAREYFDWERPQPMWRMVLNRDRFRPVSARSAPCVRLTACHAGRIEELYRKGGGHGFSPEQVDPGVFWGVFEGGELSAVAGTHLVSDAFGIAALGNVFTRPDRRGRGLATAASSAVAAELCARGIRDIVLNVRQDNAAAVHIYEKLGFERVCAFCEGAAGLRRR
jgi:ribosomal protein S18 acetylase RimI-like enzyme